MRRTHGLLAAGGLVLVLAGWGAVPGARPREATANGARGKETPTLLGVASCAAAACHNANGPRERPGSEYSTWAAADPHSRAYSVLFNERSVRMIRSFRGPGDVKPAHQDALCLGCHVQPGPGDAPRDARFANSDGVGCEACHGAAEKWKSVHYLDVAEARSLGMTNTKDLRVRAEVCVRCHVGEGDRDVNHDLIAAGHPRLRFEFGAYLATYPKHWRDPKGDFEARALAVGRVVSAGAALKLLEHRTAKVWPEFAEYECAACHHGLTKGSERRRALPGLPPGSLP